VILFEFIGVYVSLFDYIELSLGGRQVNESMKKIIKKTNFLRMIMSLKNEKILRKFFFSQEEKNSGKITKLNFIKNKNSRQ